MLILKSTRNINENARNRSFKVQITSSAKKVQNDVSGVDETRDSIRDLVSGNRPGQMMQSVASISKGAGLNNNITQL